MSDGQSSTENGEDRVEIEVSEKVATLEKTENNVKIAENGRTEKIETRLRARKRAFDDVVDLTEDDDEPCSSRNLKANLAKIPKEDLNAKSDKRKEELKCLLEDGLDGWLNDTVVFDYLRMNVSNCIVVDPVVWNDEYDLDKYDVPVSRDDIGCGLILIPLCYFDHWILIAFDIKIALIVFFDTMRNDLGNLQKKVLIIARKLQARYGKKDPATGKHLTIRLKPAADKQFPEQEDESSCGPLTCMIGEAIAKGEKLSFSKKDIPMWRQQAYQFLLANEPPPVPRRLRKEMK